MKPLLSLIVFLCCTLSSAQSLAIPVVSIDAPERVGAHSNVFVNIIISGLQSDGSDTLLGGFQFDFFYDPDFLVFNAGRGGFGSGLGNPYTGQAVTDIGFSSADSLNVINLYEASLLEADPETCLFCTGPFLEDLQTDSFTLATLVFYPNPNLVFPDTPAGPGTGNLTTGVAIHNIVLSDAFGNHLPANETAGAFITIVPEPNSFILISIGLVGLASMRVYCRQKTGHPLAGPCQGK